MYKTPFDRKLLFIAQKRPVKGRFQPFSNDGDIIFLMRDQLFTVWDGPNYVTIQTTPFDRKFLFMA